MKKIIALVIILLIIELEGLLAFSLSPVDSTGVKSVNGKKFIEYKVEEHEGWYAIARKYGISYSDIRLANKNVSDTIHIGQVVLIPIEKVKINDPRNQKNFIQHDEQKDNEPVYHRVKQKETLYAIAKKYHVTTAELKKWNQLSAGGLKKDDRLIVGYKKKSEDQVTITAERKNQEVKPEKEKMEEAGTSAMESERNEKVKEKSKRESTVVLNILHENKALADSPSANNKTGMAIGRKEVSEQGVATWIEDENINPNKFFALHRTASIGCIVRVTNRMNKRSVYVKVVGKLPDTGDNENIIIKISKASAEKLGVRDQRFQADLSYGVSEK